MWLIPVIVIALIGWFIGLKWFSGKGTTEPPTPASEEKGRIHISGDEGGEAGAVPSPVPTVKPEDYTFYRTLSQNGESSPVVGLSPKTTPSAPTPSARHGTKSIIAVPPQTAPKQAPSYTLQVGSFSDAKGAARMVTQLKAQGYAPTISKVTVSGSKTAYRVRIGRYETREQADQAADRYKAEGRGTAIVQVR